MRTGFCDTGHVIGYMRTGFKLGQRPVLWKLVVVGILLLWILSCCRGFSACYCGFSACCCGFLAFFHICFVSRYTYIHLSVRVGSNPSKIVNTRARARTHTHTHTQQGKCALNAVCTSSDWLVPNHDVSHTCIDTHTHTHTHTLQRGWFPTRYCVHLE